MFLPSPDRPVPSSPVRLAHDLTRTSRALLHSIDLWVGVGDPSSGKPPRRVVLQALYQQRIYRSLARRPTLADRTIDLLSPGLAAQARNIVSAGSELFSLVTPISSPTLFRTQAPEPAGVLLRYFEEAELRFGVDWEVLAAVAYVESKFGRVRSPSTAGAQGPMQFIPSTWAAYGLGGDVNDPHDAILGAANYLSASGAPEDYRGALYAYNHAWPYVDAVLRYAHEMARDPRNYYALYSWQLFVLTTRGDVRLTGPGLG